MITNIRSGNFPGLFGFTYTYMRNHKKIGRNEPCPCGSGKKYKRCCLESDKEKEFAKRRKKR